MSSCRHVHSTCSQSEQLSPISSERRDPVDGVYSDATRLNTTRRRVELSRVVSL